jgi:hypothetical protein
MKYILIILYPILSLCTQSIKNTPNLCIHCKHYTKDFFSNSEYGKCLLFLRKKDNDNFLVNGKKYDDKPNYYYCSTARTNDDLCGKEGKFYQDKTD